MAKANCTIYRYYQEFDEVLTVTVIKKAGGYSDVYLQRTDSVPIDYQHLVGHISS
jgi:hypothetical protein